MDETTLENEVYEVLERELPQIRMHGGTAEVADVDLQEGAVTVVLGGTCTDCGLAPMTVEVLKRKLVEEVSTLTTVTVRDT